MELQEIKENKRRLEENILSNIEKFEKATGVKLEEISFVWNEYSGRKLIVDLERI